MLRITATDINGRQVDLSWAHRVVIRECRGVPAHSLEAEISGEILEELAEIYVYEGDKLLFEGLVDEQNINYSSGVATFVAARSTASLLLDNEAQPKTFVNPTLEVIFKVYLEPLGFEKFVGENLKISGEFNVTKGMSCYKVLSDFCKQVSCDLPEITGRALIFGGEKTAEEIVFSSKEREGDYRCSDLAFSLQRCNLISEIRVRTGESSLYRVVVPDEDAKARNVRRIRYLDASLQGGLYRQRAESILNSAREKEKTLTLNVTGCVTGLLSRRAKVMWEDREFADLSIRELRYTLRDNKENTKIILDGKRC